WHEKKKREASAFREAASAAMAAASEADAARKAALALGVPSPNVVELGAALSVAPQASAALQAITDWQLVLSAGQGSDLTALARNIETPSVALRTAIETLRAAAAAELA